jgi:hypothetical protein
MCVETDGRSGYGVNSSGPIIFIVQPECIVNVLMMLQEIWQ